MVKQKMSIVPLKEKYRFDDKALVHDFPDYLQNALEGWIKDILRIGRKTNSYSSCASNRIREDFCYDAELKFREKIPNLILKNVLTFIFKDNDRAACWLQWLVNEYGDLMKHDEYDITFGNDLEDILQKGGSAYAVIEYDDDTYSELSGEPYRCKYNLVERVPGSVVKMSEEAISDDDNLKMAWESCYSVNPNYKEVVQQCQNTLEGLLRDKYLPDDKKAQLGKLITDIEASLKIKLDFIGNEILDAGDNKIFLKLIKNIPSFRGMHTSGTGKIPTKDNAVFILHTTIYIWNLHNKK